MKFKIGRLRFLREGWRVLHRLATDQETSGNRKVKSIPAGVEEWDYCEILGSLPWILGEILSKEYEYENELVLEKAIFNDLYKVLRRNLPQTFFDISDEEVSHKELISRFHASAIAWQERLALNAYNPVGVARSGFKLVREAPADVSSLARIAWGIALVGWASRQLLKSRKCKFCPRRAVLSSQYCYEHGQMDLNDHDRNASLQYQKYRTGKEAWLLARRINKSHEVILSRDETSNGHTSLMLDILSPSQLTFPAALNLGHLGAALRASARVRTVLGMDKLTYPLDYHNIIKKIRDVLTPFYDREEQLPKSILSFENWFDMEERVQPKKRGTGKAASRRIRKAISMAERGYTQVDIAKKLGVRQSTVSAWKAKNEEFRRKLTRLPAAASSLDE